MTTQLAVLNAHSGQSLTAKLFTVANPDTEVTGNTITVTERTNARGQYVVSIARATVLPAGNYTLILFVGSVPVAIGQRTFAGTDGETATTTAEVVELSAATIRKFVTEDTGETSATAGSVAKLSQGGGVGGAGDAEQATLLAVAEQVDEIHAAVFPADPDSTPLVLVPSAPGLTTGGGLCLDAANDPKPGVVVYCKLAAEPAGDSGHIFDGATERSTTSAENGVYQFAGLALGATYYLRSGSAETAITIPLNAGTTYELPSFSAR